MYSIVKQVSRYVLYCEVSVLLQLSVMSVKRRWNINSIRHHYFKNHGLFQASLSSSYTQHVTEEGRKFRQFLLQLVIENFVVVKNMAIHPAHVVVSIIFHKLWPVTEIRYKNEPPHDKTNKMVGEPSEDTDQPGHPPSVFRVFAVRMKKAWVLSYPLSAQWRLWSDWANSWFRAWLF